MREIVGQFQASHGIVLHILPLIKPTAHAHSHHFFLYDRSKAYFSCGKVKIPRGLRMTTLNLRRTAAASITALGLLALPM